LKYYVGLDGETHEVERTSEGVRIDERDLEGEIVRTPDRTRAHLKLGDLGYSFLAERREDGWRIQLGGRHFDLTIEDERAHAIRELTGDTEGLAPSAELRAPMPGLVVNVMVEPGQTVEADTPLVVVEAMKMENELRSDGPGLVASVEVVRGQAVNRDDVLVTFESEAG
jgi:biotin carboxyl carrier protein